MIVFVFCPLVGTIGGSPSSIREVSFQPTDSISLVPMLCVCCACQYPFCHVVVSSPRHHSNKTHEKKDTKPLNVKSCCKSIVVGDLKTLF